VDGILRFSVPTDRANQRNYPGRRRTHGRWVQFLRPEPGSSSRRQRRRRRRPWRLRRHEHIQCARRKCHHRFDRRANWPRQLGRTAWRQWRRRIASNGAWFVATGWKNLRQRCDQFRQHQRRRFGRVCLSFSRETFGRGNSFPRTAARATPSAAVAVVAVEGASLFGITRTCLPAAVTARGGAGAYFGGAGTIYTTSSFFGEGKSTQIIVDNGGIRGTNTLLSSLVVGADLILSNGAAATLSSSATRWNSRTISSNASVSFDPSVRNIGHDCCQQPHYSTRWLNRVGWPGLCRQHGNGTRQHLLGHR